MEEEYEFKIVVGCLIRKHIRTMLECEIFDGRDIRFMEEKGWIESLFRIKGKYTDAMAVQTRIEWYLKTLAGK